MKDITVIIPVHVYNEQVKEMLTKAIESVPSDYLIHIVNPNKLESELVWLGKKYDNVTVLSAVDEDEPTDFCTLVNRGVSTCGTNWFSILEFDDEYTPIWFSNVEKEMEYKSDVSIFMPLTELNDFNNARFVSYGNEAPWASSFSNEIGYIDNDCLQDFFDFYLTGSVFSTLDWLNSGGLKPSIKVTFWYEFLLRLTNDGKKIYVVPKLGYKHNVNRDGSLYNEYANTVTADEADWWRELAKKECFFKKDRNKTYENNKGE